MPCRTIAVVNQKGGTVILRAVSAAKAPSVGANIFAYDGRGKVASAFEWLAKEVLDRG